MFNIRTVTLKFSTALAASVPLGTPVFTVQSAGYEVGNYAKFTFSDKHIYISPDYNRGLNVIVFDDRRNVINRQSFDTYGSAQQSQQFVNLINSLPTGRVVAIAVKDEASDLLSEAAKTAIEGLGSQYIRELGHRGSWALIGRKGAPQGTVLEAGCNNGPVEIVTHALPVIPVTDDEECTIFVESVGYHSFGGLQFTVNRQEIGLPESRGIRIAVFKENCSTVEISSYDTHFFGSIEPSNRLTQKINALPTGSIVVASVFDEASEKLQENAKQALESIGSSLICNIGWRDAWAIIGRKGASPGSVPESHVRSVSHEKSTAAAVGSTVKLEPSKISMNELYPLD